MPNTKFIGINKEQILFSVLGLALLIIDGQPKALAQWTPEIAGFTVSINKIDLDFAQKLLDSEIKAETKIVGDSKVFSDLGIFFRHSHQL